MEKRIGLPQTSRIQHTIHLVEELTGKAKAFGRLIRIEQIEANPEQPRVDCGDLEDLCLSIRQKGVLEPLLVQPVGAEHFRIIAGERRLRAAMMAGLEEVPCIEKQVNESEVLEISLIENLLRKDLHPFEEADGLSRLVERYDYTHEQVAHFLGRARSTVTETIGLAAIPDDLRSACRNADISAKHLLLQIVKGGSPENMWEVFESIVQGGANRDRLRAERKQKKVGRPRHYVFKFRPQNRSFSLNVSFRQADVSHGQIIQMLEEVLEALRQEAQQLENSPARNQPQPPLR